MSLASLAHWQGLAKQEKKLDKWWQPPKKNKAAAKQDKAAAKRERLLALL